MSRAAFTSVVASHRRSGTHVMLEYLTRQFEQRPMKSHLFAERPRPKVPTVYLVRNPVDVLWSTYRWFVQGQSSNKQIAAALEGLTFEQYLLGVGGERIGFRAMNMQRRDNFVADRGMLYAPIRFWADHVLSYVHDPAEPLIVRYESLVAHPADEMAKVAAHLGQAMPPGFTVIGRDELVGHAPSRPGANPAAEQWTPRALTALVEHAGDVLAEFGYEIVAPKPAAPTRRSNGVAVRYVSRDDHSGYGVAGRRCIEALATAGVDVAWEPQPKERRDRGTPRSDAPQELVDRYRPDASAELTVMHTMPEWWGALRSHLGDAQYVGHTVWELEQLPQSWLGGLHVADSLWVPTDWNRATYLAGGVRRDVAVVPHVATTDAPVEPPIDLPDGVTVFSTVASWHPRKRPDRTVEAYCRAFRKGDPVLLVLKTEAWTDAWPAESELEQMTWWQLLQVLRRHPDHPEVMLVNDHFTDAEVNGLLARSDCYVSLACSEGWGLGLFDAATLGTPVITTGFGGQLAYLGDDHPGLVPYRMTPVGDVSNSPHFEAGMVWAEPDLDAAAAMMRAVADGTSTLRAGAGPLAQRLRTRYSPAAVGAQVRAVLEALA